MSKPQQLCLVRASGCVVPQLVIPSMQPESAALLPWQQHMSSTEFTVLQLGFALLRLLQF